MSAPAPPCPACRRCPRRRLRGLAVGAAAALVLAGPGGGCARGEGDAHDLAVPADADARARVEAALAALGTPGLGPAAVLERFCDPSEPGRRLAAELLAPLGDGRGVDIVKVEPAWVGREPWFYVEVAARDGGYTHGFGVRVRDGCLDRAVGAGPARAGASEASAEP